jgi:hypothetical protein
MTDYIRHASTMKPGFIRQYGLFFKNGRIWNIQALPGS